MEREIGKCLTFVILQIASNFFRKILNTQDKPLSFPKDSSSPRMTKQIQILWRRLECISRHLKVNSVFSVFTKPSLGAPGWWCFYPTAYSLWRDIFHSIPFVRFVKHDPFRFIVVSPLLDLWFFSDSHAAEQIKKCDMEEGACRGFPGPRISRTNPTQWTKKIDPCFCFCECVIAAMSVRSNPWGILLYRLAKFVQILFTVEHISILGEKFNNNISLL